MMKTIATPLALLAAAACAAGASLAQTEPATPSPPAPGEPPSATAPPLPEADTATGPRGPVDPVGLVPYDVLGDSAKTETAKSSFNPMISVIFDGLFYRDGVDGTGSELLAEADGFHLDGAGDGHAHGATEEGFSLRETELTFSGSVDPFFDLWAIFSISGEGLDVEEVYAQTGKFIPGFQLKVGQFYSGIGYQNSQHPHQWDFVNTALPYELIFGGALNEAGLQLNWLPALPFYLRLGVEAVQGENPGVASYYGGGDETPWFEDAAGPRLFNAFVKVAPDLGYSSALQVGGFYGTGRTHQELHDEDGDGVADEAFQGTTDFWGIDVVYKYDSPKEYGRGDLTLQAEYIARGRDLELVAEAGEAIDPVPYSFDQDAWYVQGVYGFAPRWTFGARYDRAGSTNEASGGGDSQSFGTTSRWSGDVTFNPTEFSRVRVQYDRSQVALDGGSMDVNAWYLQLQLSLGAHGAHKF
jgi:hypothetical protein